jgi:hypothetical protein
MNKKIFALCVLLAAPTHAGNTPSSPATQVKHMQSSSMRFSMTLPTREYAPAGQSRNSDSDDDDKKREAAEKAVQTAMAGFFLAYTERMHSEGLPSLQEALRRDGIETTINWNISWGSEEN